MQQVLSAICSSDHEYSNNETSRCRALSKPTTRLRKANSDRSEAGVALIEATIVLPFLILFIMGIWDLGRALGDIMTASRIAFEGSRFAGSVPGLETPTEVSAGITKGETSGHLTTAAGANVRTHQRVRDRISQILARYGIPSEDVNVSTLVVKDKTGAVANNSVTINIQLRFRSTFPLLDQLIPQIGATSTGPYMFTN